jgi:hypothetical protein
MGHIHVAEALGVPCHMFHSRGIMEPKASSSHGWIGYYVEGRSRGMSSYAVFARDTRIEQLST